MLADLVDGVTVIVLLGAIFALTLLVARKGF